MKNRKEIVMENGNRICALFGIRYPIVSGGMVWCSGCQPPSAKRADWGSSARGR